ncbi:efflux RND transporter periplasmic adaptor subunit [Akkermansia muciniphila]|nr:efflux RND transporter periplasmic adaptor subunit [Akkermansia muciniphila]
MDGVVVKRLVNIGQTVVSSMSASSLFYIATDLSKLKIWAAVNEADIGSIRKGQEVLFTVDAFAGRKFKGTVDKIRLDATMTSNVVTYIVDIDVPNPDKLLIPYLTANVQFVVEDIRNAFLVSNAALRFRPETELVSAEQKAAFDRMQPELAAPSGTDKRKKPWFGNCGTIFFIPTWSPKGKATAC